MSGPNSVIMMNLSDPQQAGGGPVGGLNDELDTNYIDVAHEDTSFLANVTRSVAQTVGRCCKPREMLVLLRLLKAITFCFLVLTVAADLMYIIFVEFVAKDAVGDKLGGFRDTTIRIYGLGLAIMAILIELDMTAAVRHFAGVKAFVPRSLLLFFIATITSAHPLQKGQVHQYDDDQVVDDDSFVPPQIPNSAIVFQMVTSWILALCAMSYFALGLLCFDRFTSRAFLSSRDPVMSTAIPQPSPSRQGHGDMYEPPDDA